MEDDGFPSWRPQSSLQSSALFEAIEAFPIGETRNAAVDAWAEEFRRANVNYLIDNYKKSLEAKASPMRALRRRNREEVAWYTTQLAYVEPMRAWWLDWVDRRADELKKGGT